MRSQIGARARRCNMWPFRRKKRVPKVPFVCPHKDLITGGQDRLCAKYGCPDDPDWRGDGCR